MSKKKQKKNSQRNSHDVDLAVDPEAIPGSEGGLSDEETMRSRGSDMPVQELEIEGTIDESVKRKRQSIEDGSMDSERIA